MPQCPRYHTADTVGRKGQVLPGLFCCPDLPEPRVSRIDGALFWFLGCVSAYAAHPCTRPIQPRSRRVLAPAGVSPPVAAESEYTARLHSGMYSLDETALTA